MPDFGDVVLLLALVVFFGGTCFTRWWRCTEESFSLWCSLFWARAYASENKLLAVHYVCGLCEGAAVLCGRPHQPPILRVVKAGVFVLFVNRDTLKRQYVFYEAQKADEYDKKVMAFWEPDERHNGPVEREPYGLQRDQQEPRRGRQRNTGRDRGVVRY